MAGPDRRARPRPVKARTIWSGATVLVVIIAAAWGGCSIERDYKMLSFFFDGVPSPGAVSEEMTPGGRRRVVQGGVGPRSAHSAFVERRCSECHGETGQFGFSVIGFERLDAGICVTCHESVLTSHTHLHGPVAAQRCLWCHDPHESVHPVLLNTASPALCMSCHRFQMQRPPQSEVHADLASDCLECHRGHGGDARYFLKSVRGAAAIGGAVSGFAP